MTQGIQHSTRSYNLAPAVRSSFTSAAPVPRERRDNWFVRTLGEVFQLLIRPVHELPPSLVDDVGLRMPGYERRAELNRLDARFNARFY